MGTRACAPLRGRGGFPSSQITCPPHISPAMSRQGCLRLLQGPVRPAKPPQEGTDLRVIERRIIPAIAADDFELAGVLPFTLAATNSLRPDTSGPALP